ncbi:MAG: hypothetical protein CUN55_10945 [Phototrophicales bacterium]|nr:MAG: hypothetical protein CUN55_10945 [Phototrophicales bacterium]
MQKIKTHDKIPNSKAFNAYKREVFAVPTLADVAARAGVSIATVSKVLSNTPYFSEETRQKVLAAVEAVGYVPNLAARALSSGKTGIIGVVFPRVYDAVFTDPLAQHILEGVEAACIDNGYNLLLSTPYVNSDKPDERYLKLLESGYVEGLIALDNVPRTSIVKPALEKEIPTISIGYGPNPLYVRSDDHGGAKNLMQYILSLGHQHIGIISVDERLNYAISPRMNGLRAAIQEAGLDFEQLPIGYGDFSTKSGFICAQKLLSEHPELTALVCINDRMALGAIQYARSVGRKVPHDLSIVGYDDIPLAQFTDPPLTTINQHGPKLGHRAIEMLLSLLQGETPKSEIIPTELVVRQSSAFLAER